MDNLALTIAWEAHINQKRKGSNIPYIIHPIEVAVILIENSAEEDLITAGLLHDTLEDTNVTLAFIKDSFGKHVAKLVKAASEPDKLDLEVKLTVEEERSSWKTRKTHTINYLSKAPFEVKLLTCADKLSNIRSMVRDYEVIKNELWKKFNAGCSEQKWYYEGLVDSLKELTEYKMYTEFKTLVEGLFSSTEVMDFINNYNIKI
jgi:(p)ppGpp synthase/HD superfamily hydrolase